MSKSDFEFSCPACGNKAFETSTQPRSIDDLAGGTCSRCNHTITKNEIISYARKIAVDLVKKGLNF